MNCEVLKSGSTGNCVILNSNIAVDMGVTFKLIEQYVRDLNLVFLTHVHS